MEEGIAFPFTNRMFILEENKRKVVIHHLFENETVRSTLLV